MKRENYDKNLNVPKGSIDVVIDTDTFNEVDDQFALTYLLASGDKLKLKAIYAAPFFNHHSESPKDGMEKSYEEICRLLTLVHREDLIAFTFKGSDQYLPNETTPVSSAAAEHLAELAMNYSEEKPLYIVAIGAITNVASALLLRPEIADRIVVVWLGGNSREFHDTMEFNLYQDIAAGRVVFGSGAPVVQLPCMGVVSGFAVPYVELEYHLKGKNELCDFLVGRVKNEISMFNTGIAASRVLWDVTVVAWLLNDDNRFMLSRRASRPVPEYDGLYAFRYDRDIEYVYYIERDALASDLFAKLAAF